MAKGSGAESQLMHTLWITWQGDNKVVRKMDRVDGMDRSCGSAGCGGKRASTPGAHFGALRQAQGKLNDDGEGEDLA